MIEARITKRFDPGAESAAFDLDLAFEAKPGVTVLFGASGAGKTLTLECIAGFCRPDAGRILLNDRILFDAVAGVDQPPRARHCGYVFQQHALFPHMKLRDNLMFGAERLPRLERHRAVNEMLERFQLAPLAGRYPHELSGGQKQRGSIARALIAGPEVLLLDEPARGLDLALRDDLHQALFALRDGLNIPILLVTHDLEEAFALGDALLLYAGGRIVQRGAPRDLSVRPVSREAAVLMGLTNIFDAEIRALDPGRNTSRLMAFNSELSGPYFPGRFLGDRVQVCLPPSSARLAPGPGENRVPAELARCTLLAGSAVLEFSNGLAVHAPLREYAGARDSAAKDNKEWYLELPPGELRLIG